MSTATATLRLVFLANTVIKIKLKGMFSNENDCSRTDKLRSLKRSAASVGDQLYLATTAHALTPHLIR